MQIWSMSSSRLCSAFELLACSNGDRCVGRWQSAVK